MALFRRRADAARPEDEGVYCPRATTFVGRGPACDWRHDDVRTSRQHALIEYTGRELLNGEVSGVWELRDLGSRCGTWLNGQRIRPSQPYSLARGAALRFGRADGPEWVLIDDGPPAPMAVDLRGDRVVYADANGLFRLDGPRQVRLADGRWLDADGAELRAGRIEQQGRAWLLLAPDAEALPPTLPDGAAEPLALVMRVSADQEELREVELVAAGRSVPIQPRVYTPLLFALARARASDVREGEPSSETGWVDVRLLPRLARVAEARLSLYNLRLKRQLGKGLEALGMREERSLITDRTITVSERDVWQRRLTNCDVRIFHI